MILNYVNFTDGKQLRKQLMLPELLSMLKNLVEFAPAGAKKVPSFSSATCAAKKILLGLQTCAPSALGGRRVRCSQAANSFVKKYYFFDSLKQLRKR